MRQRGENTGKWTRPRLRDSEISVDDGGERQNSISLFLKSFEMQMLFRKVEAGLGEI